MQSWRGKIGEFLETHRSDMVVCFDWNIPNIVSMPASETDFYTSPSLKLHDTFWYLALYLKAKQWTSEWITVILKRYPRTYPVRISVGVKKTDGEEQIVRSRVWLFPYEREYIVNKFMSGLTNRRSQLATSDALTITCTIWTDTPTYLRGISHFSGAIWTKFVKDEKKAGIDMQNFTTLRKQLKDLLDSGDDHDVTIRVRDREFNAHRCILRARSTMLKNEKEETTDAPISTEDCDPETFDEFLHYIYTGGVEDLSLANVMELYYLADKYDVSGLKESCVHFLKTSLSVKVICDVITLATTYGESELLEYATNFFMENASEILVSAEWRSFVRSFPDQSNDLYVKSFEMLHDKRSK